MTTEEIAKLLRTSPETVRYWVHIGKLKGFKLGRRRLFDQSEIDAFIANAREKAGIA
ncbi:MAG: helix-turn-helix domain-containing protein [Nocardioidaceae bacterium]|nr:MAG: helix-turn-helix domain-containing protein [Nocardioidaceae bacterium]